MTWFFLVLALLAGAFLPIQAGINAQLRNYLGSAVTAALVSFLVGTIVLFVIGCALRVPMPSPSSFSGAPWWVWIGGVLGAFFVYLTIVLAESLGAAVMVSLIIAGQMVASLALDHYGLIGYQRHPVNLARVLGTVLLVSGALLMRYKGNS